MMTLMESGFISATRPSSSSFSRFSYFIHFPSSPRFASIPRSIKPLTLQSKNIVECVENLGNLGFSQNKMRQPKSFLHPFQRKKHISVSDLAAWEWCERKMNFSLPCEMNKYTKAMKDGKARHAELEKEVSKKVEIRKVSEEETWAVKFMNFIICANQLQVEGLTREIPLTGFVNDIWMVGVIDEIKMPVSGTVRNPRLIDTKTRSYATIPPEVQKRNGRFQLMCYKYLWDTVVTDNFPVNKFFNHFDLNPRYTLSEEIQEHAAKFRFPAKTLKELVMLYGSTCCTMPLAHDQLLLRLERLYNKIAQCRYEFQGDHSLLGEVHFTYDSVSLKSKIKYFLEFWFGERNANYVPVRERWKCRSCKFASECRCTVTSSTATASPPHS